MTWYWFAIINALAMAGVGLIQKRTLRDEHSLEFVTMIALIRLILFYSIFWGAINWGVTTSQFLFLCLAAILSGTAFWMVSRALRRQELSVVFPIINIEPALTAIIALIVLREGLNAQQALGLGVLVIGTYFLQLSTTEHRDRSWRVVLAPFKKLWSAPGGHFACFGLLFYAVSSVNDRFLLQNINWTTYLAYGLPLMTMYFLLLAAIRREKFTNFQRANLKIWPWLIGVGALYLLSNIANAKAVGMAAVGLVVAIKRSATLIDILVSGKMFHEKDIVHKFLASAMMLGGIILIVTA